MREMEAVMGPGTKYVTMLRDPVDMFESAYVYYRMSAKYNLTIGRCLDWRLCRCLESFVWISEFLKCFESTIPLEYFFVEEFAQKTDEEKPKKRVLGIGKNQMLYDLGLDEKYLDSEAHVRDKIKQIEKNFDLVMIAEFFSESLLLLKHNLCWQLADLTSFQLNSRMESGKVKLDPETRRLLAAYLKHDYLLYNHFKQRFIRATQFWHSTA